MITVENGAVPGHDDHAIGVAVESEADVRPARDDRLSETLGMRRPALGVDVAAVGGDLDHLGLDAESPHGRRRDVGRGPVRGVDDHAESVEGSTVDHRAEMFDVVGDHDLIGTVGGGSDRRGPAVAFEERLDGGLTRWVEFRPTGTEDLDAVVVERVVRCGDHEGSGPGARGAVRDERRRREAQAFDGGTRLRESGHEGGLERGRRLPGVAPDDVAVGSDDLGHGSAEAAGETLGQLRSVTATQAIGAEPHGWLSAWCTAEPYEPS